MQPREQRDIRSSQELQGGWIHGFSKIFITATNNQMKLMVLLKGFRIVKISNLTPIYTNVCFKEIISMLINGNLLNNSIIGECMSLLIELDDLVVEHSCKV